MSRGEETNLRTRWAIVAKLLAQRIARGEYPVGTVMPNEVDLAEQMGVSRSTVRAALGELQQAGMISRKRNAGTRVESVRPLHGPGSYNQTLATIEDVVQYGAQTDRKVQEIASETTDKALAALLDCPLGQTWCGCRACGCRTTHRHRLCAGPTSMSRRRSPPSCASILPIMPA
jgi:DNA-binding GntR family transcriptional regulator